MRIYVKKLQKLGNVPPQEMRNNTRHVSSSGQALTKRFYAAKTKKKVKKFNYFDFNFKKKFTKEAYLHLQRLKVNYIIKIKGVKSKIS